MTEESKYALNLLKKKDYYISELYKKMLHRGFPLCNINKVIKDLIINNYINDKKLVHLKIEYLINEKRYGKKYIYNYFEKKHISINLIYYFINNYYQDIIIENKNKIINELKTLGKDDGEIEYILKKKGYEINE